MPIARIVKRGSLGKRDMDKGAIAGTVIGVVLGVAILCLCLYPVIIKRIKSRRARRMSKTHSGPHDQETGLAPDAPAVTTTNDGERRLSSTDSVKPIGIGASRGDFAPRASKDGPHPNYTPAFGGNYNATSFPGVPTDHATSDPTLSQPAEEQMATFPSYDGAFYPGADPAEPQGANADYYSPTIPSEAFGMYAMPTGPERTDSTPSRLRGSSLRNSIRDVFRRGSGRDRRMSSTTSAPRAESTSGLQTMISRQDPTDSPTQLSPTAQDFEQAQRGLPEPVSVHVASSAERGFHHSPSPPLHPAPGTVNPMSIMPASSESERWYKTDYELSNLSSSPPVLTSAPAVQEVPVGGPVAPSEAVSPENQGTFQAPDMQQLSPEPTLPFESHLPTRHDTDKTVMPDSSGDVQMADIHSQNFLLPGPDPNRHLSYPSDHSTPAPGLASTNPSTHTSPNTENDTPSPESSGIHSDFRHSMSPPVAGHSPRHGTERFACSMPGCGQVFDQHHKLK